MLYKAGFLSFKGGYSMYRNRLMRSPYFRDLLLDESPNNVVDSLTKVVSRKYILKYIQHLVSRNVSFSMSIIDVDNFKLINDYYGHIVGDQTLEIIGSKLIEYVGNNGIVGRYGGDEFLVIYEKDHNYNDLYDFYYGFYEGEAVFRRYIVLDNVSFYITGTIGSASFPKDADNYAELMEKADKALYRGKMKGRNCFIIYSDDKHRDIDTSRIIKEPIHLIIDNLSNVMDNQHDAERGAKAVLNYINERLQNTHAEHFDNDFKPLEGSKLSIEGCNINSKNVNELLDRIGMFSSNDLDEVEMISQEVYQFCRKNNIISIMIYRVKLKDQYFGYFILTDSATERIWQDEDRALLVAAGKIYALNSLFDKK